MTPTGSTNEPKEKYDSLFSSIPSVVRSPLNKRNFELSDISSGSNNVNRDIIDFSTPSKRKRTKAQESSGFSTQEKVSEMHTPYGAKIGGELSQQPQEDVFGPDLPSSNAIVNQKSLQLLDLAAVNNALCGVINVNTGVIHLHPLADEAYRGGDPTFGGTGDGYRTSRFPYARPYTKGLGYPTEDDQAARPLGNREHRKRSMSLGGAERKVSPIKHLDPLWNGEVSHEQLARRVGGLKIHESVEDPKSKFIGFTVWKAADSLSLVCSSRALNKDHFYKVGKTKLLCTEIMNSEWAEYILYAFKAEIISKPVASSDDIIYGVPT